MKELAIGEIIELKCVKSNDMASCETCFFSGILEDCADANIKCSSDERIDGENVHFEIVDNLTLDVIKKTTHGITNKELIEVLSKYPEDATVCVECCNIKDLTYCKKDNTIRID